MAAPLRTLLVTGEYPPAVGGVGDYTYLLGRALIERGHRVSVLAPSPGGATQATDPAMLDLKSGWGWRGLGAALRTIAWLRPEIVHIQYQTGAYAMHPAITLLPWCVRRLQRRPALVITAHDLRLPYLLPKADQLRNWLTGRMFAAADAVIVTNAADRAALQGTAPRSRELYHPRRALPTPVSTIPIGSNILPAPPPDYNRSVWRQRLDLDESDVLIAYFGLLSRTKGVLELLAALRFLHDQTDRRYRLVIIGGAAPQHDDRRYAAEVQRRIAANGLSECVTIIGPCDAPDVSAWLLAADLVVLPFADGTSYRRGSLLAALAHGCPTITTPPAAPLDPALLDGQHALLASADPGSLAAAIRRVADDQSLQRTLSNGARALAALFDWSHIAAAHETVYHSVQRSVTKKVRA